MASSFFCAAFPEEKPYPPSPLGHRAKRVYGILNRRLP